MRKVWKTMSGINKDDREAPFKRLMYANENNSKPKTKRRHAEASKQRPNKHQQKLFYTSEPWINVGIHIANTKPIAAKTASAPQKCLYWTFCLLPGRKHLGIWILTVDSVRLLHRFLSGWLNKLPLVSSVVCLRANRKWCGYAAKLTWQARWRVSRTKRDVYFPC